MFMSNENNINFYEESECGIKDNIERLSGKVFCYIKQKKANFTVNDRYRLIEILAKISIESIFLQDRKVYIPKIPFKFISALENYNKIFSLNYYDNININKEITYLHGKLHIGKYESSLVNKSDSSNIVTNDDTTGNILLSENTDKAIAVQAGMSSWRYCTIGNMYTNAISYAENLNSHMLKNSEWGAVAYLTYSKFGRNGTKVALNDNNEYLTADKEINVNSNQSSTGNVYGIYDLSGCAYEYVSTYYIGGDSDKLNYGDVFTTRKISDEYSTVYIEESLNSAYKIGDATYETVEWENNDGIFVNSTDPFFKRGASHADSYAGIFYFGNYSGGAFYHEYSDIGFRMCLAIK